MQKQERHLMYPKLIIDMDKLKSNIDSLAGLTHGAGCSLMIVTKSVCADEKITDMIAAHPEVDFMADSRMDNLKKYYEKARSAGKQTVLMRLPMLCETEDVIKYADISFNSELKTVRALNHEAAAQNRIHKVMLMIDVGDLREGIFYTNEEEIFGMAEEVCAMSNIELYGIGVSLTCYGSIIPDRNNLGQIADFARRIEKLTGKKLQVVSGGNSSSVHMIWNEGLPEGITNLRLGESYLLGNETAHGEDCPGTVRDAFIIEAQLIEIKEKPSIPIGKMGKDAFGNVLEYEDKGVIRRGILGIGRQDTVIERMIPVKRGHDGNWEDDSSIEILGGSSDHMLVDLTKAARSFDVGDTITFRTEFAALFQAATSPYMRREYINIEARALFNLKNK